MKIYRKGKLIIFSSTSTKWCNTIRIIYNTERKTVYIQFERRYNGKKSIQQINITHEKAFLLGIAILSALVVIENNLNVNDVDILAVERDLYKMLVEIVKKWSK